MFQQNHQANHSNQQNDLDISVELAKLKELPPSEQITAHFYLWELLGRGWLIYPYPVDLEPIYTPFLIKAEMASFDNLAKTSTSKAKELKRHSDDERVDTLIVWLLKWSFKIISWILETIVEITLWIISTIYKAIVKSKWYLSLKNFIKRKINTLSNRLKNYFQKQRTKWQIRWKSTAKKWSKNKRIIWITKRLNRIDTFLGFTQKLKVVGTHLNTYKKALVGYAVQVIQAIQALLKKEEINNLPPYHSETPMPSPDYGDWVEMDIVLPDKMNISLLNSKELLLYIASSDIPVSFEIIGKNNKVIIRIATPASNAQWLQNHIQLLFPQIIIRPADISLKNYIETVPDDTIIAAVDYGFSNEWMLPIRIPIQKEPETLLSIMSLLDGLEKDDTIILQVMTQGVVNPWQLALIDTVTDYEGKPFFVNAPELTRAAQQKSQEPFLATVVRVLVQSSSKDRNVMLQKAADRAILNTTSPQHSKGIEGTKNAFVPLEPKNYTLATHVKDICERTSHRTGMILNISEVSTLFHFPPPRIRSKKLQSKGIHTVPTSQNLLNHATKLGLNNHMGSSNQVTVSVQHRLRHTHIVGATGSGKSTFLLHLMKQDLENGFGFAMLDPHGDTIEGIIPYIPKSRLNDVILIDPSDIEFPIGFNILSASSEVEKIVLSSDITALFRRFASSWGDQMEAVLANAINILLEHPKPQTLISLRKFLVDDKFRNQIVSEIDDAYLEQFWLTEFKLLRKQSVASIITRLDTFLRPKVIRAMMQQTGGLDIAKAINSKKIILIKLAQGLIGEQNAHLLGSLFTAKLYQAAQGRQTIAAQNRHPFFLYIDEFQHFITPSMEALLSGARKFGLGLVLAHQDLHQLTYKDARVANSLLSNAGIRICFRVGDNDAIKLENGFANFSREDLQRLEIGQAIVRVGGATNDCNIQTPLIEQVPDSNNLTETIKSNTRKRYSKPLEILKKTPKRKKDSANKEEQEKEKSELKKTPRTQKIEDIQSKKVGNNEQEKKISKPIKEEENSQQKVNPPKKEILKEENHQIGNDNKPPSNETKSEKPIDDFEAKAAAFKAKDAQKITQKEHARIQNRIQKAAHIYQFKAILEYPVELSDGSNNSSKETKGRVDVAIFAGEIKIACEVSVTNTAEYEVQNIKKCFDNGFDIVLMCSQKQAHLQSIQKKAHKELTEQQLEKTVFGNAQHCTEIIHKIAMAQKQKTQNIRGYRVKVNYNKVSDQSGKNAKDMLLKTIIDAMRK